MILINQVTNGLLTLQSCSVISASLTSLVAYLWPDFSSQAASPPSSLPLFVLSIPASKLVTRFVHAPQGGNFAADFDSDCFGGSRQETSRTVFKVKNTRFFMMAVSFPGVYFFLVHFITLYQ